MPLGGEVRLSPSDIVLDGHPATSPSKREAEPPIFGPFLLWPNGRVDQDATWKGGRPLPKRHYVRGDLAPPPQTGSRTSQFSAHVYYDQTAAWIKIPLGMEVGLGPGHILLH